jgi:hypothetical protein
MMMIFATNLIQLKSDLKPCQTGVSEYAKWNLYNNRRYDRLFSHETLPGK